MLITVLSFCDAYIPEKSVQCGLKFAVGIMLDLLGSRWKH